MFIKRNIIKPGKGYRSVFNVMRNIHYIVLTEKESSPCSMCVCVYRIIFNGII